MFLKLPMPFLPKPWVICVCSVCDDDKHMVSDKINFIYASL